MFKSEWIFTQINHVGATFLKWAITIDVFKLWSCISVIFSFEMRNVSVIDLESRTAQLNSSRFLELEAKTPVNNWHAPPKKDLLYIGNNLKLIRVAGANTVAKPNNFLNSTVFCFHAHLITSQECRDCEGKRLFDPEFGSNWKENLKLQLHFSHYEFMTVYSTPAYLRVSGAHKPLLKTRTAFHHDSAA